MDQSLQEVYSLVLPQAPFVIAAYGILWAALVVYVGMVFRRLSRMEREVSVVEESIARRSKS